MEPWPDQVKGSAQCVQRIAMPVPLPSTRVILTLQQRCDILVDKNLRKPSFAQSSCSQECGRQLNLLPIPEPNDP